MAMLNASRLSWLVFLTVSALLGFAASATIVAAQELRGGWQDIAITEDMVAKNINVLKGDCEVALAWGAYSTKRTPSPTEGNWVRLHWADDSRTITPNMVGYGLRLYIPENTKCTLKTKGYSEYLQQASKLASGWNFISVSNKMVEMGGKSFNDISNTCVVEKIRLYAPGTCKLAASTDSDVTSVTCDGDYMIIKPETKLSEYYRGKGVWAKAASDCTLDDGTPVEALCKQAECASKSGCIGNDYKTFGCINKECTETIPLRECTAEEKAKTEAKEGVDLVPGLVITPMENLKGGDTIQVMLSVKNAGKTSTKDPSVFRKCAESTGGNCNYFYSIVYFYKDTEYGLKVIPDLSAMAELAFNEIKPSGDGGLEVIKQSVKIPEDFSGKIAIVAVVDSQQTYPEAEGGKDNNKLTVPLTVRAATLPNLVPTAVEVLPSIESLPKTIYAVKATIKNTGEMAVTKQQPLESKVSILKENTEICSGSITDNVAITPGTPQDFSITVKAGANPCILDDKNAVYWAVVDVDTLQTGNAKGSVAESNENDNKQSFRLNGPPQCTLGSRQAYQYCSISTGTWSTQKGEGQQCGHNFECTTDLCIGKDSSTKKCTSEKQKTDILKLLGIG